jgi:hypothetical protein
MRHFSFILRAPNLQINQISGIFFGILFLNVKIPNYISELGTESFL